MMGLPWREEGQQYVEGMAAGIPFQTAGHKQVLCKPDLAIAAMMQTYYSDCGPPPAISMPMPRTNQIIKSVNCSSKY